jgi:hypothetical protein
LFARHSDTLTHYNQHVIYLFSSDVKAEHTLGPFRLWVFKTWREILRKLNFANRQEENETQAIVQNNGEISDRWTCVVLSARMPEHTVEEDKWCYSGCLSTVGNSVLVWTEIFLFLNSLVQLSEKMKPELLNATVSQLRHLCVSNCLLGKVGVSSNEVINFLTHTHRLFFYDGGASGV